MAMWHFVVLFKVLKGHDLSCTSQLDQYLFLVVTRFKVLDHTRKRTRKRADELESETVEVEVLDSLLVLMQFPKPWRCGLVL